MLYPISRFNILTMASISLILRKKPNKYGEFPIVIRITKDRKSSFVYTGQYLHLKDWDEKQKKVKKSHPNSVRLNNLLLRKLSEANDNLLELEKEPIYSSAKTIRKQLKGEYGNKSFFVLAELYLDELEQQGKYNRVSAESPMIKHFREFTKGDITFQEINETLLKRYQAYLSSTRNITKRTVVNHLVPIRTILNRALRDGLADRKFYPFGKGKIVIKFPQSLKIGLTEQEVKLLETANLKTESPQWHARNVWLFCFYLAGMRVSDALRMKWGDIANGRLYYAMGKNDKADSLLLPQKVLTIIEQYQIDGLTNSDTLFPELRDIDFGDKVLVQKQIRNADKKFNKHLGLIAEEIGLEKPLKMHIARHTFGNISGDRIPIQMLQKLYRHTAVTTTIGYQANFIHKETDEALNQVIDF